MMVLFEWGLAGFAVAVLFWLALRHWKRMSAIDRRLEIADASLLQESVVDIEEVIQAPIGSQLHEQQMVVAVKVDQR